MRKRRRGTKIFASCCEGLKYYGKLTVTNETIESSSGGPVCSRCTTQQCLDVCDPTSVVTNETVVEQGGIVCTDCATTDCSITDEYYTSKGMFVAHIVGGAPPVSNTGVEEAKARIVVSAKTTQQNTTQKNDSTEVEQDEIVVQPPNNTPSLLSIVGGLVVIVVALLLWRRKEY